MWKRNEESTLQDVPLFRSLEMLTNTHHAITQTLTRTHLNMNMFITLNRATSIQNGGWRKRRMIFCFVFVGGNLFNSLKFTAFLLPLIWISFHFRCSFFFRIIFITHMLHTVPSLFFLSFFVHIIVCNDFFIIIFSGFYFRFMHVFFVWSGLLLAICSFFLI